MEGEVDIREPYQITYGMKSTKYGKMFLKMYTISVRRVLKCSTFSTISCHVNDQSLKWNGNQGLRLQSMLGGTFVPNGTDFDTI